MSELISKRELLDVLVQLHGVKDRPCARHLIHQRKPSLEGCPVCEAIAKGLVDLEEPVPAPGFPKGTLVTLPQPAPTEEVYARSRHQSKSVLPTIMAFGAFAASIDLDRPPRPKHEPDEGAQE